MVKKNLTVLRMSVQQLQTTAVWQGHPDFESVNKDGSIIPFLKECQYQNVKEINCSVTSSH